MAFSLKSDGFERGNGRQAQHRHHQRTDHMRTDCANSPQHAPFLNQGRDLGGERGKRGQSAQKAGDDKQAPLGRKTGMMGENGKRDTDQVAADQIRRQRTGRNGRKQRVERHAQPPAQYGAERCSQTNG